MLPPITSKRQMYQLLRTGSLGYTLPAWENWEELDLAFAQNPNALYAIRWQQAGGKTVFFLTPGQVLSILRKHGSGWNVSPMLDDSKRLCYGHLFDRGALMDLELLYSEDKAPCRLKQEQDGCRQQVLYGLSALHYCQRIMDNRGYETLRELLANYPSHIIEFTVMADKALAFGPTNTIIWEVRNSTGEYEMNSGWGR